MTLNGHDLSDTSPLVGEVDARSASGGGSMSVAPDDQQRPPSLTLPHKGGGNAPVAWRRLRSIARAVAVSIVVVAGLVTAFVLFLGPPPLGKDLAYSTLVVDRDGRLLRPFATADGRWRLPARADDVDPRYLDVLFAYEDRRFRQHPGVDPLALLRATGQFIFNGHHVSGASTLTMQVARLLEPRPRTLLGKLRQVVRAIEIERTLSKDEVLALYLSIAPFGGNLEGVRAASLAYFGKEPRRLTLGEAALLVALPQSPEARRPDRAPEVARAARNRVLDRVAGLLPASDIEHAKGEPVPIARVPMPMLAPIAAEEAVARAPDQRIQQLTIDAVWQKSLEDLARSRARALGPNISVAILAVDHATGEILAKVASADYFDQRRAGHVDMTRALRSPGSTLKPFIYGIGFEDGLIHPETLIDDRPARYGSYAPENFDLSFQGTVPVRKALQLSLNVPAIAVLDRIGASRLTARLAQAGGSLVLPDHEVPGLAMGLGGVGITLTDLVTLYGWAAARRHDGQPDRPPRQRATHHAPAHGAGRRLVCRQHPAWNAAAGECRGRADRVQDRHQLRLSRCLGRGLRRQAHHRGLGRTTRRSADARVGGPRCRRADPVRGFRPQRQVAGTRWRRHRKTQSSPPTPSCRCRCSTSARTGW